MTVHEASIHIKRTNPAAELSCRGVYSCAETTEKPNFKRFSGIEKVHRNSIKITVDLWRSGWDSNPRNLAVQLISSQSRYDHFDTAPYLSQHQHLGKRGELMGRTSKNIKLRIPEKPHKIKGFRSGSYRVATTISSADPSTAWVHLRIFSPVFNSQNLLERKAGEKT